jgi:plastocyanin
MNATGLASAVSGRLAQRRTFAAPLLAGGIAVALLAAGAARAGTVQVQVTGPDGRPAADVLVQLQPAAAWTPRPLPPPVQIAQRNIRFVPFVTAVPVGATVRFVNEDSYDHHVRSAPGGPLGNQAPAKSFEFRMSPGQTAEVRMDVPGALALACHLHGSMRGHLVVSTTPFFAVTDANGRATVPEVPEGEAELRLWHPEQLSEQAAQKLPVPAGSQVLRAEGKLNFSPRRRPPPSAPPPNQY